MPVPSWRIANAVAPTVTSKSYFQIKDPTSITNFPTTRTLYNFYLGKNNTMCDPDLYTPHILPLPPTFLGLSLNPLVAAFQILSEFLLNPTAN